MKLLPFEDVVIETRLSPAEVRQQLQGVTRSPRFDLFRAFRASDGNLFEGTIQEHSFEIQRIISGRNSFMPVIKGVIESNGGRTWVRMKLRLHIAVVVFLLFWMGVVAAIAVMTLWLFVQSGRPEFLIPWGMLLFAYVLAIAGFSWEAAKAKKILHQLLEH